MKLTPENKAYIDRLSYEGLLSRWRNAPLGDRWFQDEQESIGVRDFRKCAKKKLTMELPYLKE